MRKSFQGQLFELRKQVDAMVESLLQCQDADLDRVLELEYEGRPFRTNLRAAVRYTIEEYRIHEGQVAGNQFLTESLRHAESGREVEAFTPHDRTEAAWLAAEFYLAAASFIARLLGYPEELVDEHPRAGEWSTGEIVEHLIHMERSGQWSLHQLTAKARSQG